MNITKLSKTVFEFRADYKDQSTFKFMLSSDWHLDNPKCNRALLKRHLDQAREQADGIFIFGDIFCAMQGKWDKRASKSDVLPEHQKGDYLDALVYTAAKFLEPYTDLLFISPGNHETSVKKRHETDLIQRLAGALQIPCGTYSGWVQFAFERDKQAIRKVNLKYHHGYGGGGPVTRGVIQTNRQSVFLPDADVVVSGHTHDGWVVPITREKLKGNGETCLDYQWHIKCPTYKEEYLSQEGWHIERGAPPKPLGCVWMEITPNYQSGCKIQFDLDIE